MNCVASVMNVVQLYKAGPQKISILAQVRVPSVINL